MNEIICPMPGKILRINVQMGDSVEERTEVMIHEAMKMENTIFAGCTGTVHEILINEGDSVDTNQVLMRIS